MDTALAIVGRCVSNSNIWKSKGNVNMWFFFSVVFSGISISLRETVCCVECFWWLILKFQALAENLCQSQFYQRTLNLNQGYPHPVLRLGIPVQPGRPIFHFLCWRHCSSVPEDWGWTPLPEPFGRNGPENVLKMGRHDLHRHSGDGPITAQKTLSFNFYTCNKMWWIQLLDEKRRRR